MTKFVKLLTAAYVAGALRHPHEGALSVTATEGKRLVGEGVAEDVTDGFSAEQVEAAQPEPISAPSGGVTTTPAENPHQSEVETDEPTPQRTARKPTANKE